MFVTRNNLIILNFYFSLNIFLIAYELRQAYADDTASTENCNTLQGCTLIRFSARKKKMRTHKTLTRKIC